ncbi:glycosyl hydrolase family 8, partial [Caenispirillum bisanense]
SAIARLLIVEEPFGLVLRPGLSGFQFPDRRIANLSYWVWPALDALASLTQDGIWSRLGGSGLDLLRNARFGPDLPPDWLDLTRGLSIATDYSSRFGYDAIRIPLYLVWGGRETDVLLAPFVRHWSRDPIPAWTDLIGGGEGGAPAPTGMAAVAELVRARFEGRPAQFPCLTERDGYYSGTLLLLARLAEKEATDPA